MRYSKIFGKTTREIPKEAETISHNLLIRAGFIDRQLAAGIYSYLPLGYLVVKKIQRIIRKYMNEIEGQEVFLPSLQPKELWERSCRWDHMDPPLFKVKDRHEKELALGSTHEEVMTDLVSRYVNSYKDLPLALYQIQTKFRNEMRSTGGLLRVREFLMKDMYSFHCSQDDLDQFYLKVINAYRGIFTECGFHTKIVQANSGTIGGSESHEFMTICPTGEDKIVFCTKCDWAANTEMSDSGVCPKCGTQTDRASAIENGHVFKLGVKYSDSMGATFIDRDGTKKSILMGCYGIGIGRLMATVVEVYNDKKGIVWPKALAPFDVHLVDLGSEGYGEEVYNKLKSEGLYSLWDERDVSAGEKFADADLIGIPVRLVVSERNNEQIEFKRREEEKVEILSLEEVLEKLK